MKVVVIDDDPIALDVARATLEGMGHAVVTRNSAMGASAAVMREAPDIVLVDLNMPALGGDEWLRLVAERAGSQLLDVPSYVLFSGADESRLAQLVQETCAVGYISKTAGPAHFEDEFRRLARDLA